MSRYTSVTDDDRRAMLERIGVGSLEDLFDAIPASVRLDRPLDLPDGMAEQEVSDHLAALAARNRHADAEVTFLGAGMYDHYVPALIDSITQRSEFLTPYTPYQPEISQGGLQVMFEFQTAISELTGLPVSNASMYEGPSSVASAGYLARSRTGARGSSSPAAWPRTRARRSAPTRRASGRPSTRWGSTSAARPTSMRSQVPSTTTRRLSSSSSRASSAPSRSWGRCPRRPSAPAPCSSARSIP